MARILIVDDHPADRGLLVTFLGYYGHIVFAARDGVEGLALALAEQPDLIITDITMPVMDGYELARHVRADPELSRTRLMFYTGANLSAEVRQLAADCEVAHILTKPAEPETILDIVSAALESAPPTARPAPDAELDRVYLRLLTSALRRNVEELKAEVQAREQAEATIRRQADIALRAALAAELTARQTAEILQAASQALASTLDQDTILTTLLEHLAHLVPYDSANVMLLQPGGDLVVSMQRGGERWTDPEQIDGRVFDPTRLPILHQLITSRQSVLASDTRHDPRWTLMSSGDHLLSWFGVPLLAGGELIGLYSANKTVAGFFTLDHVRRAEALAAPAAIAIQNARLFDALHQGHARLQALSQRLVTVQEAERRHIARELHDEIGQLLTGLRLTLELITRLPPSDQATRLAEAHAAVQDLIAHVRSLSLDLRPAMLDDMGLLAALLWHFRRYTEQTAITVECKHRGLDQRFPAAVETVAYRVVQEALTNVARHATVTAVEVWLLATPEQLSVRISDAGRGFDSAEALQPLRSSGLLGMQERVTLLGGSLSITSALGDGTQVVADLPLNVGVEGEGHDDHDRSR